MSSSQQHLTESIERVLKNWLDGESARSAIEIVSDVARWGTAKDFISDVYGDLDLHGVNVLGIGIGQACFDDLINKVPGGDFVFDREHLRALWATGPIPPTLTHDELDDQAPTMFLVLRHHHWMVLEGRHFDAESPKGVDSVLQLPFFRRYLDSMQTEKIKTCQDAQLPEHLMTWTGELDTEDLPF